MSLDISLVGGEVERECTCAHCGNVHTYKHREELWAGNITHNLNRMAEAAGIYLPLWHPEDLGIKKARHLIDTLAVGIERMNKYRAGLVLLEPENRHGRRWGTYQDLLRFVTNCHAACVLHPDADIEVSR